MKVLGMTVSFCIKLAMSNRYYISNGEIRRQTRGGATGNSLTMKLSRMFVLGWDESYAKTLKKLCIEDSDHNNISVLKFGPISDIVDGILHNFSKA